MIENNQMIKKEISVETYFTTVRIDSDKLRKDIVNSKITLKSVATYCGYTEQGLTAMLTKERMGKINLEKISELLNTYPDKYIVKNDDKPVPDNTALINAITNLFSKAEECVLILEKIECQQKNIAELLNKMYMSNNRSNQETKQQLDKIYNEIHYRKN